MFQVSGFRLSLFVLSSVCLVCVISDLQSTHAVAARDNNSVIEDGRATPIFLSYFRFGGWRDIPCVV